MEKWRLLDIEYEDPSMNLALEEAIVRTVGSGASSPSVRFWRNANAVVIGRFQKADYEVNLNECKRHNVSVVRRFTGGGAVYQDKGNLNCAISFPENHSLVRKTTPTLYRILGAPMIRTLNFLGLIAYMNSNNIYIGGKKISGIAGAINWGAAFHHCTFLVDTNTALMTKVLNPISFESTMKYVRSNREPVTTLKNQLGEDVSVSKMKGLIANMLERVWDIELIEEDLTKEEKSLARKFYEEKYSNSEYAILL